jgi:hypothetical protein
VIVTKSLQQEAQQQEDYAQIKFLHEKFVTKKLRTVSNRYDVCNDEEKIFIIPRFHPNTIVEEPFLSVLDYYIASPGVFCWPKRLRRHS